jgi:hypothetical protein
MASFCVFWIARRSERRDHESASAQKHSQWTVARRIAKVIGKDRRRTSNQIKSEGPMTLDLKPHRNRDGSIDLDFYKHRAARLRQQAIAELVGALFARVVDWIGRTRQSGNRSGLWLRNVSSRRRRSSTHNSRVM